MLCESRLNLRWTLKLRFQSASTRPSISTIRASIFIFVRMSLHGMHNVDIAYVYEFMNIRQF